jgi:hypothetical protein
VHVLLSSMQPISSCQMFPTLALLDTEEAPHLPPVGCHTCPTPINPIGHYQPYRPLETTCLPRDFSSTMQPSSSCHMSPYLSYQPLGKPLTCLPLVLLSSMQPSSSCQGCCQSSSSRSPKGLAGACQPGTASLGFTPGSSKCA